MEDKIRSILKQLGENPDREGLLRTPARVAESLTFLTQGYRDDPLQLIQGSIYADDTRDMVILKDVDFFSLCEHHLLPFSGKCHLAYIPKGKIIGLSKLARVIDLFSRRLQTQERLTQEIANTIEKALEPKGVAVVMEATHFCMQMAGFDRQHSMAVTKNSKVITSSMLGAFRQRSRTRAEFLSLIQGSAL